MKIDIENKTITLEKVYTKEEFLNAIKDIEDYKITIKDVMKNIKPLSFIPHPDDFKEPYYISCKKLTEQLK